jgi:hypothetical protein
MRAYVLAATVLLSGCSVGMAVSGDHNPELGTVKSGVSRSEIEMHLGSPVKISSLNDGLVYATYEYEVGNEPSAGRAIAHGVMDVLTIGLGDSRDPD